MSDTSLLRHSLPKKVSKYRPRTEAASRTGISSINFFGAPSFGLLDISSTDTNVFSVKGKELTMGPNLVKGLGVLSSESQG